MTGKVLESNPKGLLVLILPVATVMVLLYKAWRIILVLVALLLAWAAWDTYQWRQKCAQIDPVFNQLIRDNQGIVTKNDLLNLDIAKGRAAQRYLDDKVKEYGAYRREVKGISVYYFITSSTLGTIFDDSEPEETEVAAPPETPVAPQLPIASAPAVTLSVPETPALSLEAEVNNPPATPFASLVDIKEERKQATALTPEPETLAPSSPGPEGLTLIQSELAKRLDTTSSTIARRKDAPDFTEWSQTKDPDGLAWIYDPETKLFTTT
ncbi:hypothetical protein [Synechocystis sp. LKSZ1]|uniref:hypothetical protein n=1 Tax=Synechocystis sp. LKSZ1 TaxID=3144951 RepID=UPI00336C1763